MALGPPPPAPPPKRDDETWTEFVARIEKDRHALREWARRGNPLRRLVGRDLTPEPPMTPRAWIEAAEAERR